MDHVEEARRLLEAAHTRNMSRENLAAAQVHATLAVELAVRDLIEATKREQFSCRAAPGDSCVL
jgi:hypothetical protein